MEYSTYFNGPLAIRYPRGEAYEGLEEFHAPIRYGKSEVLYMEKDIAILAVGNMVKTAIEVREKLKEMGKCVTVVNARFVKPLDEECIQKLIKNHSLLVTIEENVVKGGYGESVMRYAVSFGENVDVLNIGVPNIYLEHGDVEALHKEAGLDVDTIVKRIINKSKE